MCYVTSGVSKKAFVEDFTHVNKEMEVRSANGLAAVPSQVEDDRREKKEKLRYCIHQ
jgi:peptide methionine sulfoxide reductase MsrB